VAVDVNVSGSSLDVSAISTKRRLVEQILKSHGTTDDNTHKLDIEISSYLACKPTASEADDAMLFWKTYAAKYPTLQYVARCYLSISASSVPVESMFSTTGLILNSKRSSIVPQKPNYITFIHDNCC
jgi:hAT family C-terminal dimerisation region